MSRSKQIITIINSIPQPWRLLIVDLMGERDKAKADLQNHEVLAALPEVQEMIAGAYEAAAQACPDIIKNYDVMKSDGVTYEPLRTQKSAKGMVSLARQNISALTTADAIAARDAMVAEAEARALDSVTTLHRVIADIRAATVGSKPMLSDLAQALVAWRDEAVKAERQTIADACTDRADYLDDAAKWGGSKQYLASLKGGAAELRNMHAAIRKRGEGQP